MPNTAVTPMRHRSRARSTSSWHSRVDHPDDQAARLALITELHAIRANAGLERHHVTDRYPQLGYPPISAKALFVIEASTNWQIRTLQTLARMYDRRLHLDVVGLTVPDDGDPLAAMYAAMRPANPAAADELAREVLVRDLARIRKDLGLSLQTVGGRLGVSAQAVALWEACSPGVHLASVQRHTRVLGGRLGISLQTLEGA
ncbi:hypothetical protein [Micromonospora haikouensis]|uniref:hypothetical protein n=1 Tax=Micromonospora haikouensis TaxID=686309 RepID=UPI003D71F5E8